MAAGMSDSVLTIRDLRLSRGTRTIVGGVDLSVRRGEIVALMGPSGVGKTMMLRAIAGLDPFAAGEIEVDGLRLQANGATAGTLIRALHGRVGMVFQFHHLFAHMTALHNVWLAPVHVQRQPRPQAETRARELLALVGVADRADSFPHELSGGEAQRVAIARALAVDPPLLLMDEPTASLDVGRRGELATILRSLVEQGRTLIVATHDLEFARLCAERAIVLADGRVVRDGPLE
jgi:ABC-type polar amino acid transport system ATPase subunit